MNNHKTRIANPFFATRHKRPIPQAFKKPEVVYAKLPIAPVTASPVPHLTSLYHFGRAGEYGNRSYPGNCGGKLIKDLLMFFRPKNVLDPMTGSGTCRDVCAELQIECSSSDMHQGIDACDPQAFPRNQFEFIWLHPPYWRQKLYTNDPRDLSRAATLNAFLERYGLLIENCAGALTHKGKLVILMGDYQDRDANAHIPLIYWTKHLAFKAGLRQHCTDIIRFGHGASSSKKVYRSSFIPGLHDVCMVFEK